MLDEVIDFLVDVCQLLSQFTYELSNCLWHFARIDSFTLLTMLERAQPYLISLRSIGSDVVLSIRALVGQKSLPR